MPASAGRDARYATGYVDLMARRDASDSCLNCSKDTSRKTVAIIYQGIQWQYLYCFECRSWWRRHSRYRYQTIKVDDKGQVGKLLWRLESDRDTLQVGMEYTSAVRRGLRRGFRKLVGRTK